MNGVTAMEKQIKAVAPEILLEEYRQLLASDEEIEALPLVVTGNSMSPFLVGGRDRVFLSRLNRPAKRGDILLYRRNSGAYVLHRVFRWEGETLTMVGDAQWDLEPGIRREQVLAVVTRVQRKGSILGPGDLWWDFFETLWIRLVPLRRTLLGLYSILCGSR